MLSLILVGSSSSKEIKNQIVLCLLELQLNILSLKFPFLSKSFFRQ